MKRYVKLNVEKCNQCKETFSEHYDMVKHKRIIHSNTARSYYCRYCSLSSKYIKCINKHEKICKAKHRKKT